MKKIMKIILITIIGLLSFSFTSCTNAGSEENPFHMDN